MCYPLLQLPHGFFPLIFFTTGILSRQRKKNDGFISLSNNCLHSQDRGGCQCALESAGQERAISIAAYYERET